MLRKLAYLVTGLLAVLTLYYAADSMRAQSPAKNTHAPRYTADGKMEFPADYREWIFLSSGVDMSYNPRGMAMGHSMFDNVFVNPESYKAFMETGTWPDKTVMVLEVRGGATKGSINHTGHFQTAELMGTEVHVKDETRFPNKWAFFEFDDDTPSKMVPTSADCYSCHAKSAAVDTTFVQFYPTLLQVAKKKNTLSPAYVKEAANAEAVH